MGKLTDILRKQGTFDSINTAWGNTKAAGEYGLLPKGEYIADIIAGEAIESRSKGTPGYKLTFEVTEGEYARTRIWHEVWFTENAMARTKRDLEKLGVTELNQLEKPLPAVFRCKVKVVLRRDDDFEANEVRRFDVTETLPITPDAFAPRPPEAPDEIIAKTQTATTAKLPKRLKKRRVSPTTVDVGGDSSSE